MRFGVLVAIVILLSTAAFAGQDNYLINFDLITKSPAGEVEGSIQLQGIRLSPGKRFDWDLGEMAFFLTASGLEDGAGILTVEFYQYQSRRKQSAVISDIVAEVDFTLGSVVRFEAINDRFGVDLAFSIVQR